MFIAMDNEHDRYATLSRRQVALFERNPICELCFHVCLDLSEEYGGGIHFELLQSLEAADSFCERIILNPWDLLDIDQYYHWLERQLDNSKPAVTCAFATISVTLSCMDGLPEPVLQLSHDIRGLIGGGQGGELYDNLRSAARYSDILIHADTYGDIPPQPDLQRELEQFKDAYAHAASEILTLKKQLKMKNEEQKCRPNFTIENHGSLTFIAEQSNDIHDNNNCPIYVCPPNDSSSLSSAPGVRPENDSRTKKLFLTPDGIEDLQRTEEEKNRFLNYLADHHWSQRQIDCYKDNPVNKAIICFCIKWKRLKYINKSSPAAIHRFLTETCRLTCASETAAITASLGRLLKADYDKDTFDDVENYF